jgi:hypothetical protein
MTILYPALLNTVPLLVTPFSIMDQVGLDGTKRNLGFKIPRVRKEPRIRMIIRDVKKRPTTGRGSRLDSSRIIYIYVSESQGLIIAVL